PILALAMNEKGTLRNSTLVTTVMSNLALDILMNKNRIRVLKTKVGDRYILEALEAENLSFGGEQSGHLIFRDLHSTGDGLMSTVQLVSTLVEKGISLSDLAAVYQPFPQVLRTVPVLKKIPIESLAHLQRMSHVVEEELSGGRGRLLLRYSGTESALRIMLEGENQDRITYLVEELERAVLKDFEVIAH
ncbi:MAG: phosphohexomutase domain-containing protein, partial [Leptospirillum sp.]